MSKWIRFIGLSGLGLMIWVPLWLVFTGAFMPIDEIKTYFSPVLLESKGFSRWPLFPQYPTLQPTIELLLDSPEFFAMFWNSIKLVVPILVGQAMIAMTAAWGFSRFKFPLKKIIFTLYIVLMLMPFQVTMVPNYLVLDKLNLIDTRGAIILPTIWSTFPVFILYRFFKAVPKEMLEAASLDGAGEWRVFRFIGMPLGIPGIMAVMVLGFLEYWNMIEQPLTFVQDKSLWPLSLYLPMITTDQMGVSIVAAVIMLMPALLIFLWGQGYLESGIRAAGLKG